MLVMLVYACHVSLAYQSREQVIMLHILTYSKIFMYDLLIFDLGLEKRVMIRAVCLPC